MEEKEKKRNNFLMRKLSLLGKWEFAQFLKYGYTHIP